MMRRRSLVAAWACWLAGVLSAAAVVVEDVRVKNAGPGILDEAMVRSYCTSRKGAEFDSSTVAEDVKALLASGRFTKVNANVERVSGGVILTFEIASKVKLIEPVLVVGSTRLSANKVRDLLGFQPGDYLDDPTIAARAVKVKEECRKKLERVSVTWLLEAVANQPGLARLTLKIHEEGGIALRKVAFDGNKSVAASDLRKAMGMTPWWNPLGWFKTEPFDREDLQAGCEQVRSVYKDRGYLDVRVAEPVVREVSPGQFRVTVVVDEGALYHIAQISLSGITLFPEAEIRKLVAFKQGDVASGAALYGACDAIRDYYESRGYINTAVTPHLDSRESRSDVDVRLNVAEGRLTYVQNVRIRGNSITRDKVIRRELLVVPGDIFDGVRIRKSENRLRNLGYFKTVSSYDEATSISNRHDLVFDVEEQPTGQLLVGAGFSSIDELTGFMEVSQANFDYRGWPFLGGGEKVRLRADVGTRIQDYVLSFVEPWFLDRKLSLGLDLYSRRRNDDDYSIKRQGAAVSLGVPLGGPNRVDFRYGLERINVTDVDDTNEYVFVEDGVKKEFTFKEPKHVASSLGVTLSRDTRDSPFVPTRGSRVSLGGTLTGGPLGFDLDVYNIEASGAAHYPLWWRHVLTFRGRAEVVDAYGETERVPLSERLFGGGYRTIRGFRYRWVGPKAERADGSGVIRPSGGQTLAFGSAEYTIPIVSIIRLAGFYDIGNVWYDAYDFDFGSLAAGAGVGLRFDIPVFPIRIDFAWPVQRDDPRSRTERVSFWIGYGF